MTGASARRLWGYLAAQAISITGTRITMIAIPWFVLTTTGSATLTGLVAFAEMAPLVTLQALSGPSDRPARRPSGRDLLRPGQRGRRRR